MNLLVISHKETWPDPASPTGYSTTGGFPFQMQAISELFDQTLLLLLRRAVSPPPGLRPLTGHNLSVQTLPEPASTDLRRKLALLTWLPRYLPIIWNAVRRADAVHAPVPGDIGLIGILIALAQRKPLFIRHCGTWGRPETIADRFLFWLLEKIAGGRNVVLATGGADISPSQRNPNIHWIFSTTLSQNELADLLFAVPWQPGSPPCLVTVARLTTEKNIQSILRALPFLKTRHPEICLSVVGDGPARSMLEDLARELGLADRVVFHGNCAHADVLHILTQSHLFVLPTRVKEGFPKAVLEALACGLPIVASNVSVIPFLIRDCGRVLESPDPERVAATILDLLENPALLQTLGEIARQRASGYTLEVWQAQIAGHLRAAWNSDLHERT
jgi:glycosyltransferase involved in cell wall biosynthesis